MSNIPGLTVREIGEFGLLSTLRESLPAAVVASPAMAIGIGDDAAVWRPTSSAAIVVTTDSLIEGIHFRLDWTDWESLGHKALAVNLSDLAAMGAVPGLVVLSLALRGGERVEDLLALYRGLGRLAERTETLVAGGDIVRSPDSFGLHLTAIGEAVRGMALRRDGARPGDLIGVSGTLGASAAGLALLGMDVGDRRRRAATADALITAHLRPEPRLALGRTLLQLGASAAMDLSDGLLGDLPKLTTASGADAVIDLALLPVAASVRALFPVTSDDLALRGGEDYELLFTAPPAVFEKIALIAAEDGAAVTAIGVIKERTGLRSQLFQRDATGNLVALELGAFDHFR